MKNILLLLAFQLFIFNAISQDKPAYSIFDAKGKKVSYKKMMNSISKKDLILFGESHNNPISHWLQYEVTSELHALRQLILGAEMFEADNQNELNDYLKGDINKKELDSLARLWPNYKTDYAPLVNFAKENELPFIATNIPRRYANMVYKISIESDDPSDSHKHDTLTTDAEDSVKVEIPDSLNIEIPDSIKFIILDSLRFITLDSLTLEEKEWMAPLPMVFDPNLVTYQSILNMEGGHGTPELVLAQATKDATMAYFIVKNYIKDHLFLHYNGAFHSDKYEGILWFVKNVRKDITYSTISTVSQESVNKLEEDYYGLADFIICVDANMTTTY